ncbi:SH3 domain-containing protein [Halalkalibacterium halodurans]|uniref:SH3 domain-containing protein n=1 Tax=Halalkalibacterium halodurans TaxID=86665 RepID=UPI00059F62F6|nr:SH3 domain-containing protein [Halalkalibacterium halodurans]MED4173890.1 SH3 domain-containing protein [Halalkalibacterium halodurans]
MTENLKKKHRTNYPNPITLVKGQSVHIGEQYSGPEPWEHWYFCQTADGSLKGWVPKQLLAIEGSKGVALDDYTATELNVDVGEIVVKLKELNGWIWCRQQTSGEVGWIPKENVEKRVK